MKFTEDEAAYIRGLLLRIDVAGEAVLVELDKLRGCKVKKMHDNSRELAAAGRAILRFFELRDSQGT